MVFSIASYSGFLLWFPFRASYYGFSEGRLIRVSHCVFLLSFSLGLLIEASHWGFFLGLHIMTS